MTRIAFVSCANVEGRKVQPAWEQIAADPPDCLLLLGDNTYMSWAGTDWNFPALEKHYESQFKGDLKFFRQLIDTVPTLAIWDDHDFGPNDSYGLGAGPANLAASRALFDKYLGFAKNVAEAKHPPHMYCSTVIGPARVIMLDVRTYRSLASDPNPTVLGPEQEGWLWAELAAAKEPCIIVGSGSVINRGPKSQRLDKYTAFHKKLMSELRHRPDRPRRVLFLSGDIHDNRWQRWPGFFEATSSGVACHAPNGEPTDNWGLLTFKQHELVVDLHGHAPSYVGQHRVRLSDWTEIQ